MDNQNSQDEIADNICQYLREGMWFKDACKMAGISEATGYRWKSLSNEERERLMKLENNFKSLNETEVQELAGLKQKRAWCESFESRVEASILDYKHSLIQTITTKAQTDPRLALEVLQIRWPLEWGKNATQVERVENDRSTKTIADTLQKVYQKYNEIPNGSPAVAV